MEEQSGVYVFTFDDILFNTSEVIYKNIRKNFFRLAEYIKDKGPMKEADLISRDEYSMVKFLRRDDVTSKEYEFITNEINLIIGNPETYSDLEPTTLAKRSIFNKGFIDNSRVKKVYVIIRYTTEEVKIKKTEFLKKMLDNNSKCSIIYLPENKKLNKYDIRDCNTFITDRLDTLNDFIRDNDNLMGKEITLLRTGYNKMPGEMSFYIQGKYGIISYFDLEEDINERQSSGRDKEDKK